MDEEVGKVGPKQAKVKHTAIGLNMIDAYFRKGSYKLALPFTPGIWLISCWVPSSFSFIDILVPTLWNLRYSGNGE